jgi:hypothetical protein
MGPMRKGQVLKRMLQGPLLLGLSMLPVVTAEVRGQADSVATAPPQIERVEEVSPALSALALLLFPKVIADTWSLREYVRGEEFAAFRHARGDLVAVDALFRRALSLSWNNRAEALLLVTFAVLDHRRVGIKTPIPGLVLWLPLTSEFGEAFQARIDALPRKLYPDSPPSGAGDRDKLQHFFGSALLALITESRVSASGVGEFVEWGEDAFIVGGVLDERDLRANQEGISFGLALREDLTTLPSHFFHDVMPPSPAGSVPALPGTRMP